MKQAALRLLWSTCLTALIVCFPVLAQTRSAVQHHAQRWFSWTYKFAPVGRQGRDWFQVSSTDWYEVYESGEQTHFTVVDKAANVDGVVGVTVINDVRDIIVFIPDVGSRGAHPDWLRFRHPGGGVEPWSYLGQITEHSASSGGQSAPSPPLHSSDAGANARVRPEAAAAARLGDEKVRAGDFRNAIAQYKRAVSLDPAHPEWSFKLGYSYFHLRDYQSAANEYRNALNQSGNAATKAWSHLQIGRIYDLTHRRASAIAEYKTVLQTGDKGGIAVKFAKAHLRTAYTSHEQPTAQEHPVATSPAASGNGQLDQAGVAGAHQMYVAFSFSRRNGFGGDGSWGAAVNSNEQAARDGSAAMCIASTSEYCGTANGGSYPACKRDGTTSWVALATVVGETPDDDADGEAVGYDSDENARQAAVANCNKQGCHAVWSSSVDCGRGGASKKVPQLTPLIWFYSPNGQYSKQGREQSALIEGVQFSLQVVEYRWYDESGFNYRASVTTVYKFPLENLDPTTIRVGPRGSDWALTVGSTHGNDLRFTRECTHCEVVGASPGTGAGSSVEARFQDANSANQAAVELKRAIDAVR